MSSIYRCPMSVDRYCVSVRAESILYSVVDYNNICSPTMLLQEGTFQKVFHNLWFRTLEPHLEVTSSFIKTSRAFVPTDCDREYRLHDRPCICVKYIHLYLYFTNNRSRCSDILNFKEHSIFLGMVVCL